MATMNVTTHDTWTPAMMSRDALVAMEPGLVLWSRIKRYDKDATNYGKTIEVPLVSNLSTNAVGDDGSYTPQSIIESSYTITINQFYEASISYRDDLEMQSILNIRKAYGPKVGQALSQKMEDYILDSIVDTTLTQFVSVAGDIAVEDLLDGKAYLDAANVPMADRHLLVSAGQMNAILAIDKFSNSQFIGTGRTPVTSGEIKAPIFGCEPLWSTRVNSATTVGSPSTTRYINLMWHKEAFLGAAQRMPKIEEFRTKLATDLVGSAFWGAIEGRDTFYAILGSTNA